MSGEKLLRSRIRYKDLSLQQLRTFCAVCERGGYAPAARSLSLTTPAVWEQSRGLENYFGLKLLARHGNEVRPTPDGRRLLELLRPILVQIDSVRDILQLENGAVPAQLNVLAPSHAVMRAVSPAAQAFLASSPGVVLSMRVDCADQSRSDVSPESANVALVWGKDKSMPEDVPDAVLLGEMDFLLAAPPGHPLVGSGTLRLRDLANTPLVLSSRGTFLRDRVEEVLVHKGVRDPVRLVAQTDCDETTLALVATGIGTGIVIDKEEHVMRRGLDVRSLRQWLGVARIYGSWLLGGKMPPICRQFLDTVGMALAGTA